MDDEKKVAVIVQGDQYALQVKVMEGDAEITPDDCDAMQIQIGDEVFKDDNIEYDGEFWLCFITEEMTTRWQGYAPIQARWKTTSDGKTEIAYTEWAHIEIDDSIFKEAF